MSYAESLSPMHLGSLLDGARLLLSSTWKSSIGLAKKHANAHALSRSPALPAYLEEDGTIRQVNTNSGGEQQRADPISSTE